ncbi:hypothetical protein SAMN05216389_111144 [Oceanobacillus limi]|uniref:Tfp pilus assembly protein PilN n=1 Tax=Oceanobacillus limi TaxID=930131 RepID=A0A1I0EHT4_9BACI|nr:hypothetical protein [Oceanobacillus limi]SET44961.1 hypothetical protein SAMN05216389_111144 [Oceanobacillus limi]
MNTEINLLEQQPKKNYAPFVMGVGFLLLLAAVSVILYIQKGELEKQIVAQENKLIQFENLLRDYNQETATEQELLELQDRVNAIQNKTIPNVALYKDTLNSLETTAQLSSFTFSDEGHFLLEANFGKVDAIAEYVSQLLNKPYVLDAQISNINNMGEQYQATLSVTINGDVLREELGDNG